MDPTTSTGPSLSSGPGLPGPDLPGRPAVPAPADLAPAPGPVPALGPAGLAAVGPSAEAAGVTAAPLGADGPLAEAAVPGAVLAADAPLAEEEGAASAEEGAAADVSSLFLLLSRYLHLQIHKIHQNSPSGIFPDGGFLFCPFRQDCSPSQRVGSRSPIPASTGMLEDSTPTPRRGRSPGLVPADEIPSLAPEKVPKERVQGEDPLDTPLSVKVHRQLSVGNLRRCAGFL